MMRTRWIPVVAALTLLACGDDGPTTPTSLTEIAGSWTAEGALGAMVFTTGTGSSIEVVDWLARGASVVLELRSDGTTTGGLFVPAADEDGGDIDADLAGLWAVEGERVTLDHEVDTFLRDLVFDFDGDVLVAEEEFDGTTIRVVLHRR